MENPMTKYAVKAITRTIENRKNVYFKVYNKLQNGPKKEKFVLDVHDEAEEMEYHVKQGRYDKAVLVLNYKQLPELFLKTTFETFLMLPIDMTLNAYLDEKQKNKGKKENKIKLDKKKVFNKNNFLKTLASDFVFNAAYKGITTFASIKIAVKKTEIQNLIKDYIKFLKRFK